MGVTCSGDIMGKQAYRRWVKITESELSIIPAMHTAARQCRKGRRQTHMLQRVKERSMSR